MKAFKGTLLAALVLLLVAAVAWWSRPPVTPPAPAEGVRLFNFEKHELVAVAVQRPQGDRIELVEKDGVWTIASTGKVAARSMVNRVKHQLHDLTSRATVVDTPDAPELYGLGSLATRVELRLRDGRTLQFEAGDPNPSSVSYYIRPLPGDRVYTVKKSAVDYYSLGLDEFREQRFASFESKDVTRLEAQVRLPAREAGPALDRRLVLERVGDREWELREPEVMVANEDRVRRLLGRINALKAQGFIELPAEGGAPPAEYGLAAPRLEVELRFASREPLRLKVGADAPSESRYEELAYMQLEGEDTIFIARRGMLEEFAMDLQELRNRRVLRMSEADVRAVDVELRAEPGEDLAGRAGVRMAAERWMWADGVPVSGSTPSRVARSLAELEVEAFVEDQPKALSAYGLDEPVVRARLRNAEGDERVVLIGAKGPPLVDPEGGERERRYASVEGAEPVYLVDVRVLSVVRDLVREGNRKAEADREKAERLGRIPSELVEEEKKR